MSAALLARNAALDRVFERLYRRHVHEVYRYVLAVLRNPADAEDATQATFLNAYRALVRGEEPRKPRNWLLKIAHNECRQRFRATSRRPKEVEWDDRTPAPGVDENVPTADEIRTALAHLSFNQRSALVMRELEGRSYSEIAGILSLSLSAVETLLFRARRALREQLEGALTCGEAEAALSKRLDGRLAAADHQALRAHLRECPECAVLERKHRARRSAVKGLGVVQLPPSLAGFLGGTSSVTGGAITGSGFAAKAAAVVAAGVVAGGAGHEAVQAVAAEPQRTPLPQLGQLPREFAPVAGGASAPAAPIHATKAAISTTRHVRDGVHTAPEGPTSAPGSPEAAPQQPAAGVPPPPAAALPPTPVALIQPPATPQPAQQVVETAKAVVAEPQLPKQPTSGLVPPPPPLPVEPPSLPPLPPLPPPPLP